MEKIASVRIKKKERDWFSVRLRNLSYIFPVVPKM